MERIKNTPVNRNSIRIYALAFEDLRSAIKDLPESNPTTLMICKNTKVVRDSWAKRGTFCTLPPQVCGNLEHIYKRLVASGVINEKLKPISKSSLLVAED